FFSLYLEEELKWNAVGGMWALSACAEIPMMLVAGKVLARTGRMGALALSSVGVALRLAIYAIFPTPAGAITGQLLHSLCYGLFQPAAIAFISIKFPTRERAAGMALFNGLGVGLPAFLGSALGGVIAEAGGYRTLFASFVPFALASVALYFAFKKRLDQLR
ncbi:MAG: MFS transporter, partial [Rectinemataceae bacterium]